MIEPPSSPQGLHWHSRHHLWQRVPPTLDAHTQLATAAACSPLLCPPPAPRTQTLELRPTATNQFCQDSPVLRFLATLYSEGDSYAADKKEVPRSVAYTGHTARVTSSTSEQLPSTLALTPPPMASVANSDAHATGYGRRLQSAAVSTTSRTQRRAASPPPPTTALARGSRLWPCRPG
jgi:hypothetical protein